MSGQLKGYTVLGEEPFDIGSPSEDLEALLNLGDMMATSRPGLIVFVEGTALQKWESAE
jgi:hypothetical protein